MSDAKYEFVSRDGYDTTLLVTLDNAGHVIRAIRIQGMKH